MLCHIVSNYLAAQFDVSRWLLTRLVKNSLIEAAFIIVLRFNLKIGGTGFENTCVPNIQRIEKCNFEVVNLFLMNRGVIPSCTRLADEQFPFRRMKHKCDRYNSRNIFLKEHKTTMKNNNTRPTNSNTQKKQKPKKKNLANCPYEESISASV